MKPTADDIQQAAEAFEALAYFPSGSAGAKAAIMGVLNSMVGTREQLRWLVGVMLNQAGAWKGPAQLRALFCTRFLPADGIEAKEACQISGYTPDDCEAEHQQRYLPSPERKLLGPGEAAPEDELSADPEWNLTVKALAERVRLNAAKGNESKLAARVRQRQGR